MNTAPLSAIVLAFVFAANALAAPVVVCTPRASSQEQLAAKEVARYVYLRTGELPRIVAKLPSKGDAIALATEKSKAPETFSLKTTAENGRRVWTITGGGAQGTLYGAYRFAEKLGVRFYLHGDVIPDQQLATLPDINEIGAPLFDTRGIQPFHDFAEGPDWWNTDDYLAYISQLAKLRMNFIGLHCYPEGGVGPEPGVWIGLPADVKRNGRVKSSYPSAWANTLRDGMWGYARMNTSDFAAGASALFDADAYGPDVMADAMPKPQTPEQSNAVFNKTGAMLRSAFAHARTLGVKTCIGTETPLTVPKPLREHLEKQGRNPADAAVVRELYKGMFRRIAQSCPVDYYWLWTPENWTWKGNKPEEFAKTTRDIQAALDALKDCGNPFTLATCGWVLGPQHDRAAMDKFLPKNCPMSCINREVGHAPDEAGFANITGRPKWVIPWMENDPNLVAPQPWVGRMRHDAVDARRLGCTGLLGIHWRTKILAGNVAALASAAWDQSWVPADFNMQPVQPGPAKPTVQGPLGGTIVKFSAPVAGTDEPAVYQSVRYGMDGYDLQIPNGIYNVTLKFNEPHYSEAGKRVFGVKLQGMDVIHSFDMIARAGKNKAQDFSFADTRVTNGWLQIDFVREVEYPCIAGIVVAGKTAGGAAFTRKINCGGAAFKDYEADTAEGRHPNAPRNRSMPVADFYTDFAGANFGDTVAATAGKIFAKIDGTNLPEPTTWLKGPGGIRPERKPWPEVKASYAFIDELESLRSQVKGAGNLDRFDYWLNTYRGMGAMAELGCERGELDALAAKIKSEKDAAKKRSLANDAVALRIRMARLWEKMLTYEIAATGTPGELGTVANLEQHSRMFLGFLTAHDKMLSEALGAALPEEINLTNTYDGPARLVVPTVRTDIRRGETLTLKAIVLASAQPQSVTLHWRRLGEKKFAQMPFKLLARSSYGISLPAKITREDFEYYVEATQDNSEPLRFPATAPRLNQSVLALPSGE